VAKKLLAMLYHLLLNTLCLLAEVEAVLDLVVGAERVVT
jgi:hypothetical protein